MWGKLSKGLGHVWTWVHSIGRSTRHPHKFHAATTTSRSGPAAGVGLCLSGGGSRAATSGMGQLRALNHLQANGKSLLSQVSALSTVSGGSWIGVPWIYLGNDVSDEDYLNAYVADPSRLVLTTTPGHSQAETLDELPPGNPGNALGDHFSIEDLVLQTISLKLWHDTPWNMMWQVLIGRNILHPLGLYESGPNAEPATLFSFNSSTVATDVTAKNRKLKNKTIHLVASEVNPGRTHRPYMICNTAMFVTEDRSDFEFLAPVQATPFNVGIWGESDNLDPNGLPPGGGGVTSFAFGSELESAAGSSVIVKQSRQFSLTDIVGISSVAFAELVQDKFEEAKENPAKIHAALKAKQSRLAEGLKAHAPKEQHGKIHEMFHNLESHVVNGVLNDLMPKAIIPEYGYWPVRDAKPSPATFKLARFADGGSLDNTGVCGMLVRPAIDRLIVCNNSGDPLQASAEFSGTGSDADLRTRIQLASDIAYLFGYQPYKNGGYDLYEGVTDADLASDALMFKHNKVFESSHFEELLNGLWAASGNGNEAGSNARPAIYKQSLTTIENKWFGVEGGRKVEVVWVCLNMVQGWADRLSRDVAQEVAQLSNFPHYNTLGQLDLSATEVNALSNLTAWSMANDANKQTFIGLFG
jgi:hypothetical protein